MVANVQFLLVILHTPTLRELKTATPFWRRIFSNVDSLQIKSFFTLAMYLQHSQLSMAQSKLSMKIRENLLYFLSLLERKRTEIVLFPACV